VLVSGAAANRPQLVHTEVKCTVQLVVVVPPFPRSFNSLKGTCFELALVSTDTAI
jgi:hypothetical protein